MKKSGEKGAQDVLIQELRLLRKGSGLSLNKLSRSPFVLDVLNCAYPMESLTQLEQSLDQLGKSLPARALRNAYGIGMDDPGMLTKRRLDFAAEHEKHKDTVESYENEMIEELALQLVSRRLIESLEDEEPSVLGDRLIEWLQEELTATDVEDEVKRVVSDEKRERFMRLLEIRENLDWPPELQEFINEAFEILGEGKFAQGRRRGRLETMIKVQQILMERYN